jgi:hypothetical protein
MECLAMLYENTTGQSLSSSTGDPTYAYENAYCSSQGAADLHAVYRKWATTPQATSAGLTTRTFAISEYLGSMGCF